MDARTNCLFLCCFSSCGRAPCGPCRNLVWCHTGLGGSDFLVAWRTTFGICVGTVALYLESRFDTSAPHMVLRLWRVCFSKANILKLSTAFCNSPRCVGTRNVPSFSGSSNLWLFWAISISAFFTRGDHPFRARPQPPLPYLLELPTPFNPWALVCVGPSQQEAGVGSLVLC